MDRDEFIHLYKYRTLADPYGRKTAEDIVLHHRMFWQSPLEFNDPFDCDPVVVFGTNDTERRQWIRRVNGNSIGSTNRYQRRSKKRELENKTPAQHEALMRSAWRQWMQDSSVSCFSAVNDHQLMWGHYADSHRGVCFVFHEQIWHGEAWIGFDVTYSAERPIVNLVRVGEVEIMQNAILNKSNVWAYEREHRMVQWRVSPGIHEFPEAALKGFILGARISTDDRNFMMDLARRRPHLQVWEAKCDQSLFRLNISRI